MADYTVEIEMVAFCACGDPNCVTPSLRRATSVTGPKWVRGYTLWHTDAQYIASRLEHAIRAVFPQHTFTFVRKVLSS